MGTLADPKLEAFAQATLRNMAKGMSRSKAAEQAGDEVGYKGSSAKANSRKRGQRDDVKARMIELAEPKQQAAEQALAIDLAEGEKRLWAIVTANVKVDETVMPKDVVNAFKAIAAIRGWNAPTEINENVNVNYAIGDEPPTEDEWAAEHVTSH